MLFNSYVFVLAFLPLTIAGWFLINRLGAYTAAKVFLIMASLVFYGWVNPVYLALICSSVLLNYLLGRVLLKTSPERPAYRKTVFIAGLAVNIGSLFFFKYSDFFIANVNALLGLNLRLLEIALPLGISFFTFQQLSYVIDCYRGDAPAYSFVDYALFIVYFPQLVAGPIVTHDEMIPQFADAGRKKFDPENFSAGLFVFVIGLSKKVLLADVFGRAVDGGFTDVAALDSAGAVVVMLAYTFQIYFDFSGYSDMATGIGRMMNLNIAQNFDSPYKALDITGFWKRWHMTLTRFFTKYVYVPLGGSRRGRARTMLNVFLVFLLSGIWHGANWTFIVWGCLHGGASIVVRLIRRGKKAPEELPAIPRFLLWAVNFVFVSCTWVVFRAASLSEAGGFFRSLFSFRLAGGWREMLLLMQTDMLKLFLSPVHGAKETLSLVILAGLFGFAFIACTRMKNTNERLANFKASLLKAVLTAVLLVVCILSFAGVSSFLYWNF